MLTRHRIPTIFSIYMVDVLCCALGCIVLLWQVSYQEADEKTQEAAEKTAAASSSLARLDQANRTIDQANRSIIALSGELDYLKSSLEASHKKYVQISVELDKTRQERAEAAQLALVRKQEFDLLKKNHAATEAVLASLKLDLKDQQTKSMLTAGQLADQLKAHAELLAKITKSEARVVLLEKDIDAKKLELLLASRRSDEQSTKLKDFDARVIKLENLLAGVRAEGTETLSRLKVADLRVKLLEQQGERGKVELTDAQRRVQDLMASQDVLNRRILLSGKDLAEARAMISSLEGEKISLLNRARNIQAAMENRFAGITLTGKKVVFLVDMSGSMELLQENLLDPDKWPLVCETVGRLMQSLTDLRQFQVILFSERHLYPLRNDGRWHEYAGPETAKDVVTALKAVKPKGATNMYAAFEEAFRFRNQGLDTLYVLSDGLPNDGPGLPASVEKMNEQQKTELLSKHVRQKLKSEWNRYIPGQPRVRINTIGYFFESPEVGAFLWALAREHDGSFVGMSK
jgi:hypothetical protein